MEIRNSKKIVIISILFFCVIHNAKGQDAFLDSLLVLQEKGKYLSILNATGDLDRAKLNGKYLYVIGDAHGKLNNEDSAFYYLKRALVKFEKEGLLEEKAKTNFTIYSLLESQNNLSRKEKYFTEFFDYAKKSQNIDFLANAYNILGRTNFENNDPNVSIDYFKKAHILFDSVADFEMSVTNLVNVGAVFSGRLGQQDSAQHYYFKALDIVKNSNDTKTRSNLLFNLYNNLGNSYRRQKDYKKALDYYRLAETLEIKEYRLKTKKILYGNIELAYYYLGDFEKAYTYLYKYDSIKDAIGLAEQNAAITQIQEQYDNEKLRADNLEIAAQRQRNRNLLFVALGIILAGGILGILLYKNASKKRKLAEQEALLEQQKVSNLLKEQELRSIDAMIEGQEKERQKVANELHDDLGSLMATIKLHFDNIKGDGSDEALTNAKVLLEEAYQKIRGIARTKNSGVMSDQGLLKAVESMGHAINGTGALSVTIEDFGMGERMENSLELTLFRIIQELMANTIKHAEASKLNIQLTQHKDNLNIIVEDNGKGFDRSQLDTTVPNMGLTTIEKRIEHLGGNFTVDSILRKGTAILIDIPL